MNTHFGAASQGKPLEHNWQSHQYYACEKEDTIRCENILFLLTLYLNKFGRKPETAF